MAEDGQTQSSKGTWNRNPGSFLRVLSACAECPSESRSPSNSQARLLEDLGLEERMQNEASFSMKFALAVSHPE